MGVAGNLEAIRDWVDRYFYKKSEVNEFLIKMDSGLTAYVLTIIGVPNAKISIIENAATNPQSYEIKLNENGLYSNVFFFHSGAVIALSDDQSPQHATTHELNAYRDTITLSGVLQIATPIMTGYTTPSGEVTASAYQTTSSGTYYPWYAFGQVLSSNIRHIWSVVPTSGDDYVCYKFDSPVCICKIFVQTGNITNGYAPKKFLFQGSNGGVDFVTLAECSFPTSNKTDSYEYDIPNVDSYTYYRLLITEAYSTDAIHVGCLNMYKVVQP